MTKGPYLLQRGTIRKGYKTTDRYSNAVDDDYMGSSEFEWGAKPKSLRRLEADADVLTAVEVPDVRNMRGKPLIIFGNFTSRHDAAEYGRLIRDVAYGISRTKEFTNFRVHVLGNNDGWSLDSNFWWDIENDVMMSFDAEFMRHLPVILQNSWAFMGPPANTK